MFLSTLCLAAHAQIFPQDVLVAAASDLAPLMQELQKNQSFRIKSSVGSSGQLLRQIENGAPFDLFLSADESLIASSSAFRPETVRVYAFGRLGLYSKKRRVRTLADLRDLKRVAIANPAFAPYGRAARQALEEAGLWRELQSRIVLGESVRQAFQFAETGNADAALCSWSLVHDKGGVPIRGPGLRQAGAVTKSSKRPEAAKAVLDFLRSKPGQELLTRHGLIPNP